MERRQPAVQLKRPSDAAKPISRRDFLKGGAALAALAMFSACSPRLTTSPSPSPSPTTTPTTQLPFRPTTLTDYQVQIVIAAAARIIPTDDAPGAMEAGAARFIDRSLRQENSAQLGDYISGLGNLDFVSHSKYGNAFISLTTGQQDEILRDIEATPFFATLRNHTILGMFSDPIYGGNQDLIGWKLIRFSGPMFHPLQTGHIEHGWVPMDADYNSLLSRYGDINPYGQ